MTKDEEQILARFQHEFDKMVQVRCSSRPPAEKSSAIAAYNSWISDNIASRYSAKFNLQTGRPISIRKSS